MGRCSRGGGGVWSFKAFGQVGHVWEHPPQEKSGETLAIFKIPRDGEKFSWGGRDVVKSHEETKSPEISRQYMPMMLLLEFHILTSANNMQFSSHTYVEGGGSLSRKVFLFEVTPLGKYVLYFFSYHFIILQTTLQFSKVPSNPDSF